MNMNKKEELKKEITLEDIHSGYVSVSNEEDKKLHLIQDELKHGIDAVKNLENSVTFYGGARFPEGHEVYEKVRKLAYKISHELSYTILSGGGSGVMEAASRGAKEAGGKSIGLTIKLPHEQKPNPYLSEEVPFYFFFARQLSLSYTTEVCIFCPGGFGTLSELFEMLTLEQTHKIDKVPIILFDSEYWNPLQEVIKEMLSEKYKTINPDDMNLYTIVDNEDEIIEIIKNSKIRNGENAL